METFAILLLIAIIILIVNQSGAVARQMRKIEDEIYSLRKQVAEMMKTGGEAKPVIKESPKRPTADQKYWESGFKVAEEEIPVTEFVPEQEKPEPEPASPVIEPAPVEPVTIEEVVIPDVVSPPVPQQKQIPAPTFTERNPDLEKFIGENLISKIGIAILVLAIGYFVKYAIDKNWIGPAGRVAVGILCGAILVSLAHKFRNIYKGFSSVLAGGGLAVFYYSIYLAYEQFHLFSQPVAFAIMLVITVFAVVLSLLYNRQELAIIAMIGGFSAPFLVSDGSGNYKVLFTYLIILNSGLLVISYNKAWRLLNQLCFVFTVIMFGGWLLFGSYPEGEQVYQNGFLFATAFYLLFFSINIAHNIRENKKFLVSDFSILLANTALYFGAGIYCLVQMNAPEMKGLFSASMGVFNLLVTFFLFRKNKVDVNILYLLIGITLTFVSITAPIQLSGNYITIFWASEAVLLYWLAGKSGIGIIRLGSLIIWALMLISLLLDWSQLYTSSESNLAVIVNKAFITAIFTAITTYLLYLLSKKGKSNPVSTDLLLPGDNMYRICALLILFAAGALEINYQFRRIYPDMDLQVLYIFLYTVTFVSLFTTITENVKQLKLPWYLLVALFSACILLYLVCIPNFFLTQENMLQENKYTGHFIAHWIGAILLLYILYKLVGIVRENRAVLKDNFGTVCWVICTIVVVFLSIELQLLSNTIFYAADNPLEEIRRIYIKTGLPILWGLCSFVFMWMGMQYRFRPLRIISLTLFTITLIKLFIFDIRNIPAAGKIAAFFCLGVLLLVVSFMYQRLKKIIIDDEKTSQ